MARSDDAIIIVVIALALAIGYYLFTKEGGILDSASKAGAGFGGWLQDLWLNSTAYKATAIETKARGALQGDTLAYVPPTPEGYAPSNWTWVLKDGTQLGLPAGMTPHEFCQQNPGAPICAQIRAGG